ncbi:MAG: hypothetical protein MMC33_008294 [Icmadophila ericetorum]|nr:hypothetical protein [Icmadophila ericetorum]
MAQPLGRSFSFNNNDETSLRNGQNAFGQPSQQSQTYQAYAPASAPAPAPYHSSSPPPPPQHQSYPPTNSDFVQHPSVLRRPVPPSSNPQLYQADPFNDNTAYDGRDLYYSESNRTGSTTTPGVDNVGAASAGGGIAGIALGVANTNERDSGIQALRSIQEPLGHTPSYPPERNYDTAGTDTPYVPEPPYNSRGLRQTDSFASDLPLTAAPGQAGRLTPEPYYTDNGIPLESYGRGRNQGSQESFADNPYKRYSSPWDPRVGEEEFDPNDIEDDGDDGIPMPKRRSMMGLNTSVAAGAATGAAGGILGGIAGIRSDPSGSYGPVAGAGGGMASREKMNWSKPQPSAGRRKMRWLFWAIAVLAVVGIIAGAVGGAIAAMRQNRENSSSSPTTSPNGGNSGLNKDSAQIKALLNNPSLHKVFPGMDYTPFNAQYPACLTDPPSQDNVTMDMAVLSQLTNAVRLYGTDCNQTAMVLQAIDALQLTDMKVWLGVWLDNNATTGARQMAAMYDIIKTYGSDPFEGVIVGNEVLFRKDLTETQLGDVLSGVKSNFTQMNINLPVATSDLGSSWTAALASNVDIVMSNIHPFFGGVAASQAASWTWSFWAQFDLPTTAGTSKRNIISETGWPSAGGNDCGVTGQACPNPTAGAVAGIDEMNTFMDGFVCQSLANNTEYFWFEAFDEPWKIIYDTPGEDWEDKWGLMDPGTRNIKPGLKIPDCGGQTVG